MVIGNFIGDSSKNITVIPVQWSETYTAIQSLERDESDNYPTVTNATSIRLSPQDLRDLIDVLVMRYNDLPDRARENVKLGLTTIVDVPAPSSKEQEIPF